MRQAHRRFRERASLYWRLAGGTARAALWMLLRRGRDPRVEGQFDAFISYSHARDGQIAVALQHGLHRLARPWYRLRALHVFRDDTNLAANPDLFSSITAGLGAARYFILLASPEASRSEWVRREIRHWRDHKREDRILLVHTAGELHWDPEAGDFDWERTDAVPRALAGGFRDEPRYVDLRFARDLEPLSLRNPRFRDSVADLAAAIHERPKDELIGEDVRQHRRTRAVAWTAALALVGLAIAAGVAGLVAVSERDRAEEQLRLAVSRLLTQQAAEGLADQHSHSLLLALEAVDLSETPEARAVLYRAIVRRPEIVRFMQSDSGAPFDVAVSPDTETLAAATQGGVVDLWDSDSGRLDGHVRIDGVPLLSTAYNESGDTLALGAEDGRVYLFDARSGEKVSELRPPRDYGPALTLAFAGERRLAAGYSGGIVIIWDTESRRAVAKLPGPGSEAVDSLSFGSRGRRLAVSARSSAIDLWEIRDRPRLLRSQDLGPTVSEAVSLSPRGETLAVGTVHGDVRLWDSRDWQPLASPARLPQAVSDLAFSANGAVLAIATNDSRVRLWSTRKEGWLRGPMAGHIGSVAAVSFAPSGLGLVSAGRDGNLIMWDPTRRDRLAQILPVDVAREGARMAFDPGHGRLAWTTDDGRLLLAQLEASAQNGASLSAPPQALAGTARKSTISGLAFAPDGTQVAAGIAGGSSAAGTIQLWSTETGAPMEELQPRQAESGWATSLAFDPSGQPLAAVGLDRLSVLDPATGNWKRARLKGANAQDLVFSPDGGTLAAPVGIRGKVAIVDATTLEQATTVETGEALLVWDVAFSPDGETLAAGDDDGSVVLWDVASGRLLGPPLTATTDRLEDVVFSPDGGLLASSDVFARMQLWDVALHRSLGPSSIGAAPAFSDDGELLVSIWPGRGIAVRNLDLDYWREIACSLANRNLGEAEWDLFLGSLKSYEPTCPGLPRGRPAEAEFAVTGD